MKPYLNVMHNGKNYHFSSETDELNQTNKGKKQWKMVVTEYEYNLFYLNGNNLICKGDKGTLSYYEFSSGVEHTFNVEISSTVDEKMKKLFEIYILEI